MALLLDLTLAVNRGDRVLARQIKAVGRLADGLGNEQIGASVCVCGTPNRARNLPEADCIRNEVRPTGIVFEEEAGDDLAPCKMHSHHRQPPSC